MADEAKKVKNEGKDVVFNKEHWKLVNSPVNETPQQFNGNDCGVFAIMYADFLTDELPLEFKHTDIDLFRRRICAAVLRGSLDYPVGL